MESVNGHVMEDVLESKENSHITASILDDLDSCGRKRNREDSEGFKTQLKTEFMNRDGYEDLVKESNFYTLSFNDDKREREYKRHTEKSLRISIVGSPIAFIFATTCTFLAAEAQSNYRSWFLFWNSICCGGIILILAICMSERYYQKWWPGSRRADIAGWYKYMTAFCAIISHSVYAIVIVWLWNNISDWMRSSQIEFTNNHVGCAMHYLIPTYFCYTWVLMLISAALLAQWSYLIKAVYLTILVAIHFCVNLYISPDSWPQHDIDLAYTYGLIELLLQLVSICFCLIMLSRYMEQVSRMLFLWKIDVEKQSEKASDIVRRNEALVYNILPKHVATYFLGDSAKRHYDDLYSQSYSEVGVLFASMPNFADFYSEESVNNQGLECLRFLNEVISDFDAILEMPKFQDIIKIKTIGSTYMAASGLNPTSVIRPDDPIEVRWSHLALLVEFALELKKALQGINEQSFNHFTLQMGINHGPIIAGVIGARKPHYDIWGNSVNVASRMESTGKAAFIQVTEETCKILQHFGYKFEQRGLVAVKGKGKLMTYYLLDKGDSFVTNEPPVEETSKDDNEEDGSNIFSATKESAEKEALLGNH